MIYRFQSRKIPLHLILAVGLVVAILIFVAFYLSQDRTLGELKSIAETSPLVKDYKNINPTYEIFPNDPTNHTYILDYFDKNSNSGISLFIDLGEKKIIKTQTIVGVK